MPHELTNPLQSLLKSAAKQLPATTGETAKFHARLDGATDTTVILCDMSASMDELAGAKRKIDHLREAVADVWASLSGARLIEFSSHAAEIQSPDKLSAPSGGTALHLALSAAAEFRPSHTVVISDGEPDNEDSALSVAATLTGEIDVVYCGSDGNRAALDFMQRLARAGGGRVIVADVVKAASGAGLRIGCRKLLALPAPKE